MKTSYFFFLIIFASVVGCGSSSPVVPPSSAAGVDETGNTPTAAVINERKLSSGSRSFVFNYNCRLHGLTPGSQLKVWLPVPSTNSWQTVSCGDIVADIQPQQTKDADHANGIYYFEFAVPKSGETSIRIPYTVTRREVHLEDLNSDESLTGGDVYLAANNKVPIEGKAQSLLEGVALPRDAIAKARAIYDLVDNHVRYSKDGDGWGQGDVEWVCDSRFGNCTDFHSLFISLARSRGIPARFEIGFPLSPEAQSGDIGGYHCWAWFYVAGKGWVPVDISEADKHPEMKDYYFGNLTADRVAFATGRDIVLQPEQSGAPLNFFVYPHAEVDGEVVERKHVELKFSFEPSR